MNEVSGDTAGVAADAVIRPPARRIHGKRKLQPRRGDAEEDTQGEEERAYVYVYATNANDSTRAEGVASEAPAGEGGGFGVERRRAVEVPGATASFGRASMGDMGTEGKPQGRNSVQSSGAEGKRQGDVTLDGAWGSAHAAVRRRIRGKRSRIHSAEAHGASEPRGKEKGDYHGELPSTALEEGNGLRRGGSEGQPIPASAYGEMNTLKFTYPLADLDAAGLAAEEDSATSAAGRPTSQTRSEG